MEGWQGDASHHSNDFEYLWHGCNSTPDSPDRGADEDEDEYVYEQESADEVARVLFRDSASRPKSCGPSRPIYSRTGLPHQAGTLRPSGGHNALARADPQRPASAHPAHRAPPSQQQLLRPHSARHVQICEGSASAAPASSHSGSDYENDEDQARLGLLEHSSAHSRPASAHPRGGAYSMNSPNPSPYAGAVMGSARSTRGRPASAHPTNRTKCSHSGEPGVAQRPASAAPESSRARWQVSETDRPEEGTRHWSVHEGDAGGSVATPEVEGRELWARPATALMREASFGQSAVQRRPQSSPVRRARATSARSTRSTGYGHKDQHVEWKRWMPIADRPRTANSVFSITSHAMPSVPERKANDDNYARAHSLVEKLKKDYNALCREAKQKQTKLSNMRVELQQLSSLGAGNPAARAQCFRAEQELDSISNDTNFVEVQGMIYKHMVKRIRDEGLQDQADLAVLREEVETAAKVQKRMMLKACNMRDKHLDADDQLMFERKKLELCQEEWSGGLEELRGQSLDEQTKYLEYSQWEKGLERMTNAFAMHQIVELKTKLEAKVVKTVGMEQMKLGSKSKARRMQQAYESLMALTGTSDFNGMLAFFIDNKDMCDRLNSQKVGGEARLKEVAEELRELEEELEAAKFMAANTEIAGNSKAYGVTQDRVKAGTKQESDAASKALRANRLLLDVSHGLKQLMEKVERLEDADPRLRTAARPLPPHKADKIVKGEEKEKQQEHRIVPTDGVTLIGVTCEARIDLVERLWQLEQSFKHISHVLAADKREDQERQRKLLKNKAIAYLGNKRAPSDPPLDPKVPVLSSSEAVAVMETIPTNLRVDPVGETNAERKEEVASWFATNRGLLRHIFQTKGTPKSGYVNMRWLAALCEVLHFKVSEEDLTVQFEPKLVHAPSTSGAIKTKLHITDLLQDSSEQTDEEGGMDDMHCHSGHKSAVVVLSRAEIKERERKIARSRQIHKVTRAPPIGISSGVAGIHVVVPSNTNQQRGEKLLQTSHLEGTSGQDNKKSVEQQRGDSLMHRNSISNRSGTETKTPSTQRTANSATAAGAASGGPVSKRRTSNLNTTSPDRIGRTGGHGGGGVPLTPSPGSSSRNADGRLAWSNNFNRPQSPASQGKALVSSPGQKT